MPKQNTSGAVASAEPRNLRNNNMSTKCNIFKMKPNGASSNRHMGYADIIAVLQVLFSHVYASFRICSTQPLFMISGGREIDPHSQLNGQTHLIVNMMRIQWVFGYV